MAVSLDAKFVTQLGIGGQAAGGTPHDDPTGSWYASASMVADYFGAGPCLSIPELYKRDLGNGLLGQQATGSGPANALSANHHEILARREQLEAVANCEISYNYTAGELEDLLRERGPIFLYWIKSRGGDSYGHASVIIGVDDSGIIYHDPENAPNSKMGIAAFNKLRQKWKYALMQRKAETRRSVSAVRKFFEG
jgi:hypothetical protein